MVVFQTAVLFMLIIFAAYLLSEGAELLAKRFGANFTGSIVLALITTLPEYLFVFWACMKGEYLMAIGSAIGSCAILVTLGYALVILTATGRFSKHPVEYVALSKETRIDAVYLAITAIVAFALGYIGDGFTIVDGVILIGLFLGYIYHLTRVAVLFNETTKHVATKDESRKSTLYMLMGGALIIALSEPFVDAMIDLASVIGISVVAIAIIVGPFASELPEKITAFLTVLRDGRLAEISVCNFLGSKVNHNSLLFGTIPLIAYFTGYGAVNGVISLQFSVMTLLTFVAVGSVATRKLRKWHGYLFLGLYFVWLWIAFMAA